VIVFGVMPHTVRLPLTSILGRPLRPDGALAQLLGPSLPCEWFIYDGKEARRRDARRCWPRPRGIILHHTPTPRRSWPRPLSSRLVPPHNLTSYTPLRPSTPRSQEIRVSDRSVWRRVGRKRRVARLLKTGQTHQDNP
jgi:hypothetical protein